MTPRSHPASVLSLLSAPVAPTLDRVLIKDPSVLLRENLRAQKPTECKRNLLEKEEASFGSVSIFGMELELISKLA